MEQKSRYSFQDLINIVAKLRDPQGGCPWDLEQTHASLKPYMLEEACEAIDAVDEGPKELCEELGDVLLQVLLHSQIAQESGSFTLDDVVHGIAEKMLVRHPHVFGDEKADSSEQVLKNWNAQKKKIKNSKSILDGIPKSLPALAFSQKIGERVARLGFDWPDARSLLGKVDEELSELQAELESPGSAETAEEYGDVLFTVAQLSRFFGLEAEQALRLANEKFSRRFHKVEELTGGNLEGRSFDELQELWARAKELVSL